MLFNKKIFFYKFLKILQSQLMKYDKLYFLNLLDNVVTNHKYMCKTFLHIYKLNSYQ